MLLFFFLENSYPSSFFLGLCAFKVKPCEQGVLTSHPDVKFWLQLWVFCMGIAIKK